MSTEDQVGTRGPSSHRGLQLALSPGDSDSGPRPGPPSPDSPRSLSSLSDGDTSSPADVDMSQCCSPGETPCCYSSEGSPGETPCDVQTIHSKTFIISDPVLYQTFTIAGMEEDIWNEAISLMASSLETGSSEDDSVDGDRAADRGVVMSPDSAKGDSSLDSDSSERCSLSSEEMVTRANSLCLNLKDMSPPTLFFVERLLQDIPAEGVGGKITGELPTEDGKMVEFNSTLPLPCEEEGGLLRTFLCEPAPVTSVRVLSAPTDEVSREAEPRFTEEVSREAEPRFTEEVSREAEPRFTEEVSREAEPCFTEEVSREAEPRFTEEVSREAEPRFTEEVSREAEPRFTEEVSREAEPCFTEEVSREAEPRFTEEVSREAEPCFTEVSREAEPCFTEVNREAVPRFTEEVSWEAVPRFTEVSREAAPCFTEVSREAEPCFTEVSREAEPCFNDEVSREAEPCFSDEVCREAEPCFTEVSREAEPCFTEVSREAEPCFSDEVSREARSEEGKISTSEEPDASNRVQTSTPFQTTGNKIHGLPSAIFLPLSESPIFASPAVGPAKYGKVNVIPKPNLVARLSPLANRISKTDFRNVKSKIMWRPVHQLTMAGPAHVKAAASKPSQVNVPSKQSQVNRGTPIKMAHARVMNSGILISAATNAAQSEALREVNTGTHYLGITFIQSDHSDIALSPTGPLGVPENGEESGVPQPDCLSAMSENAASALCSQASSQTEQAASNHTPTSVQSPGNSTCCFSSPTETPSPAETPDGQNPNPTDPKPSPAETPDGQNPNPTDPKPSPAETPDGQNPNPTDPKPSPAETPDGQNPNPTDPKRIPATGSLKKGEWSNRNRVRPDSLSSQDRFPTHKMRPHSSSEKQSSSGSSSSSSTSTKAHIQQPKPGTVNTSAHSKQTKPNEARKGTPDRASRLVRKISLVGVSKLAGTAGATYEESKSRLGVWPHPARTRGASPSQPSAAGPGARPASLSSRQRPEASPLPQPKQNSTAANLRARATERPSNGTASGGSHLPPRPFSTLPCRLDVLARSSPSIAHAVPSGSRGSTPAFGAGCRASTSTSQGASRSTASPLKRTASPRFVQPMSSLTAFGCRASTSTSQGASRSIASPLKRTASPRFVQPTSSLSVDKTKPKASARSHPAQPPLINGEACRLPASGRATSTNSYRTQCERQDQSIQELGSLLDATNGKLEAITVVLRHAQAQRDDATRQCRKLSQELVNLRGELVCSAHSCQRLEQEKEDVRVALQAALQALQEEQEKHQEDLAQLEQRQQAFYQAEWDRVHHTYQEEANKCTARMEQQMSELKASHESTKLELEAGHSEHLYCVKQQCEDSLEELKKVHSQELQTLEQTLKEAEATLTEQIQELTAENAALTEDLKAEEAKRRELAERTQDSHILYLGHELESLKVVLDIKNSQLHQQDKKLMHLDKLTEKSVKLEEFLKKGQQENEDLRARVDRHTAMSRQLSMEQVGLHESLQKESKVNKRLSMENEELHWKLHNGDLSSPCKVSPSSPSRSLNFQSPCNSSSFSSPSVSL